MLYSPGMARKPSGPLKRGWTTGACASGATAAAYTALLTGVFPDPVAVELPRGRTPSFALAREELGDGFARAGIVKDAGDDPDVTHGALVVSTVRRAAPGAGIVFRAGEGVGTIGKAGLPLGVGEPAINPAPRRMMKKIIGEIAERHGEAADIEIEISIPGGEKLADRTWNPRLGITGGLSVLGTTGVVVPYSCSAWIDSIRRGIDVARANGIDHVAGSTGSTSENTVRQLHGLSASAMIDMGDFAGGMLKYLRDHPVPKLTIGGGFAKLSKLAQGHMDLHSGRSRVDPDWLAGVAAELGAETATADAIREAETANRALEIAADAGLALADSVAMRARAAALDMLGGETSVEVVVIDRTGDVVGRADG